MLQAQRNVDTDIDNPTGTRTYGYEIFGAAP